MSLRFTRTVPQNAFGASPITWYPIPEGSGFWTLDFCIEQRDAVAAALARAINSGVVEYHIGSRGLKRFTLEELLKVLAFWRNECAVAALGVPGAAIQSRRAAPCDV
jgi:hypothetical protein